jgi:hypothetical protein
MKMEKKITMTKIEDEQRKDNDLSEDQISLGIGLKEKDEAREEMIKKLEDELVNGELNNYISKEDKKLIQEENKKALDCLKDEDSDS